MQQARFGASVRVSCGTVSSGEKRGESVGLWRWGVTVRSTLITWAGVVAPSGGWLWSLTTRSSKKRDGAEGQREVAKRAARRVCV